MSFKWLRSHAHTHARTSELQPSNLCLISAPILHPALSTITSKTSNWQYHTRHLNPLLLGVGSSSSPGLFPNTEFPPSASDRLTCRKCNARYMHVGLLRSHEVKCDGNNRLMCSLCMRGFSQTCALKEHMRGFHGMGERVMCNFCGKNFKYKTKIYVHKCPEKEKHLAAQK